MYSQWISILKSKNTTNEQLRTLKDIYQYKQNVNNSSKTEEVELISALADYIKKIDKLRDKLNLELAFRAYYQFLYITNGLDEYFFNKINKFNKQMQFQILYFVTCTEYFNKVPIEILENQLFEAFNSAIPTNSHESIVTILRAINIFCKNYSTLKLKKITLEQFYSCMQSNECGVKDELLTLFKHYIHNDTEIGIHFFAIIVNFFPWTNKNKFFFVSAIIEQHNFDKIRHACVFHVSNFFNGVRTSLLSKNLFSPSQFLIKVLVKQNVEELNCLIAEVLQTGTENEILNLYFQWFTLLTNKDDIFMRLNFREDIILCSLKTDMRTVLNIIIFSSLFQKYWGKSKFNIIISSLMASYLTFSIPIRLLVLQLIVNNLSQIDLNESLMFLIGFLNDHKSLPSSEFRHTVIMQIPLVINFLSKLLFSKTKLNVSSESFRIVKMFFLSLKSIFDSIITSSEYQPLIFGLRILEVVLNSLYSDSIRTKKGDIVHCKELGQFLIKEGLFDVGTIEVCLVQSIQVLELGEYEDICSIIVNILRVIKFNDTDGYCNSNYKKLSIDADIDKNSLCSIYAKITMESCFNKGDYNICKQIFEYSFNKLNIIIKDFPSDPLLICKSGNHLFGHLNTINEVLNISPNYIETKPVILQLEAIVKTVLNLLNASVECHENEAANFEEIEKSLSILVHKSSYKGLESINNRKQFLLVSFWLSLKSCCNLATTLGIFLSETSQTEDMHLEMLEKCLQINITVLHLCRHKGAIEAAGLGLGKLVNHISSKYKYNSSSYKMLYFCFSILFGKVDKISTTRRGAGLTIMFHRLITNDMMKSKPLFQHAIQILIMHVQKTQPIDSTSKKESFDALALHYLCGLVRATQLRDFIVPHLDDIMISAMKHIDNDDWAVRNAANQLFGSIIPKIVGQRQNCNNVEIKHWEPANITYLEFQNKLPKTYHHILSYCDASKNVLIAPGTVILILEFLSKVEYLKTDTTMETSAAPLKNFHKIFWQFLYHPNEKIRILASICTVRAHDFRIELPNLLYYIATVLFHIKSSNFFQGLVFVLIEGLNKINFDWKYTSDKSYTWFLITLRQTITNNYTHRNTTYHVRSSLLELLILAEFELDSRLAIEMLASKPNAKIIDLKKELNEIITTIGYNLWKKKMLKYFG